MNKRAAEGPTGSCSSQDSSFWLALPLLPPSPCRPSGRPVCGIATCWTGDRGTDFPRQEASAPQSLNERLAMGEPDPRSDTTGPPNGTPGTGDRVRLDRSDDRARSPLRPYLRTAMPPARRGHSKKRSAPELACIEAGITRRDRYSRAGGRTSEPAGSGGERNHPTRPGPFTWWAHL